MSEYSFLLTIVGRDSENDFLEFFKAQEIYAVFSAFGRGTASRSILDYLGIENDERTVLMTILPSGKSKKILSLLVERMGINVPGVGIALTIPLESIGGGTSMKYLTEGQPSPQNQPHKEAYGSKMNENKYSLVIIISERGKSDSVMNAAREAGAAGGTVVHGKGTATKLAAKFFGVSIAEEKELIYIVAKKSGKDAIMKSVLEKAGPSTPAHAVAFSLPVEDVAGLSELLTD
ncbi:MAG: P-II family nitrogen regulator [Firmicutes bacterium]|nr:P-II family nitrogen regulator [Bacillota bacterium]